MERSDSTFDNQGQLVFPNQRLSSVWNHNIKSIRNILPVVEQELVRKNYRQAATITVSKHKLEKKIHEITKNNLLFTPVKWIKKPRSFNHYYFDEADPNELDSMCYGVITKNYQDAHIFKKSSSGKQDHETLGELLGFPKCCRKFFIETFSKGHTDPTWQQAINSGAKIEEICIANKFIGYSAVIQIKPECANALRYWGIRYSFHLSCSFHCNETYNINQIWKNELQKIDKKTGEIIHSILSKQAIWCTLNGAAITFTPYFKAITINSFTKNFYTVSLMPDNNHTK